MNASDVVAAVAYLGSLAGLLAMMVVALWWTIRVPVFPKVIREGDYEARIHRAHDPVYAYTISFYRRPGGCTFPATVGSLHVEHGKSRREVVSTARRALWQMNHPGRTP